MNNLDMKILRKWCKNRGIISKEEYNKIIKEMGEYATGEDMDNKVRKNIRKLVEDFKKGNETK